jgi:TRAP-type C4-dicarboxylate transport system substrate-binding protein
VIGTVAWNRLSEQEQQWLQESANEASVYQRKLWQEAEQHALQEVQKAGVEIIYPDKALFAAKTAGILQEYQDKNEMYKIIQQIQAVQ